LKWFPFNVFSKKTTDWHKALVQVFGLIPQWNRRDYKAFSEEGYNANVWVYRCIQAVAQGAASVPWTLYKKQGKNVVEIEDHPLLDLLKNPNEFQGQYDFFESMVAFLLIAGDSYVDMNGPDNGPPQEMWTMRPDRLAIVPDDNNFIGYYQYNVISMIVDIPKERVMHIKYFNPMDDFYGLSPVEVAARGIDNDNAANAWNNALLTNGARPTGAMVTESILSDPQYEKLKGEIDNQYKGAKNAGKPMLLEGGLKWQEMGLKPKDMDFINSKKLSRVEICAAFGVPPEIVGDKEHATYSNYQEARKALYEDAVLPMLNRIRDKFNMSLVKKFGDNLYLDYDIDEVEALQENADSKAARIVKEYQGGVITLNEARDALGQESVPNGDIYIIPGNVWVMNVNGKMELGPLQGQQKGPSGTDQITPPDDTGPAKSKDFFLSKAFDLETDEQKTLYWKSMENGREKFYQSVTDQVQRLFEAERQTVLKSYESGGEEKAIQSIDNGIKAWQKLLAGVYVEVMQTFGDEIFKQLKNDSIQMETKGLFNVFHKFVQEFIAKTVAQKVVQITDVTKNKIKGIINVGHTNGESIVEISQRLDSLYLDQIIPNRSVVIARTEVIGASNAGNSYAADQTGLKLEKIWISTKDNRTRDENDNFDHVSMDGVKVLKNDPYDVPGKKGNDSIMFPGDPNGQAGNIIQCRCTEYYKKIK
jgi:HK97 family phage portal protein